MERQLDATVRKPAAAEAYRLRTEAEGNKIRRIREAEAEAEAIKVGVTTLSPPSPPLPQLIDYFVYIYIYIYIYMGEVNSRTLMVVTPPPFSSRFRPASFMLTCNVPMTHCNIAGPR